MLIRHIQFFVTLVEKMHFGKAAEICNVTQPTLTAAIHKLEDELNTTLIIRGHRYLGLTVEGKKFLKWGKQILSDYSSMQQDMGGIKKGLKGTLRLGVVPAALCFIPNITSFFLQKYPEVLFNIRSMRSREIEQGLSSFELDAGITYIKNDPIAEVKEFFLYNEKYVFVCPQTHPFAHHHILAWQDALAQPLCLLSEDMQFRRNLNNIAESYGIAIQCPITSDSFSTIYAHLCTGLYCSIIPYSYLNIVNTNLKLALIDLEETKTTYPAGLSISSRSPYTPMAKALFDDVSQLFSLKK